ncbi:MAG: hypothetical protein ABSB40_03160 [Nitrososphaeria archaeon]|jgi:hypothetical protein
MIKLSQDNPDIREQVEESRGPQKKLELLVPGLKGYRTLEDLRVSDNLLRNQVADKLNQTKGNLEDVRKQMVTAGDYTNLTSVGSLISQVQQLSGEVRHAQQGYSGFVATISINEDRLNKLYDYDYNFVSSAVQLLAITSPSSLVYDTSAPASIQTGLSKVNAAIVDFKQKWEARMKAIEGILLT